MSLVRLLPAWLHAIADYAVALSLIIVALVVAGPGKAVAAGVVIGAVVLVVSLLTRYPLGLIKVLPFKVHSGGDYLAAVLLVASPFALGFTHSARGLTIFYIGAGLAVLLVSLITNYQYSPRGQALTASAEQGGAKRRPARQTDNQADGWVQPARRMASPSYPPQAASPSPSHGASPTYALEVASPSYPPQERSYPRSPAAQPTDERVTAERAWAEPERAPSSGESVPQSRPLREILAEQAANKRSVA